MPIITEEQLRGVYLIQHVNVTKLLPGEELKGGIDGYFKFRRMDAAEFDYGVLPGAFKLMNTQRNSVHAIIADYEGPQLCWFVGPADVLDLARVFFIDQLRPQEERIVKRLKERTDIRRNYLGKPEYADPTSNLRGDEERGFPLPDDSDRLDGWWAIEKPPFVLFREKEHADLWLKCL